MSKPASGDPAPVSVEIEGMGAQGEGIAHIGGEKHFIPFTLPGERVTIGMRAGKPALVEIATPSPERIAPVCKHFGTCGGCSLQHWAEAPYNAWKQGLVTSALARAGIDAPMEPLKTYPAASRRRATFTAQRDGRTVALGYNAARTHDVTALEECPILLPRIEQALPHLRAGLAAALPSKGEAKVSVTAAANGLDCVIEGPALSAKANPHVIAALQMAGIIRASWNRDLLLLAEAPYVLSGDVKVTLPPNPFLQAVEACERDMAAWAAAAISQIKLSGPVCDLFAGLGAFTFPAAVHAPVTAFEENKDAVAALTAATKRAPGHKATGTMRRDLYRNPLAPFELNKFAAAIIDPPREGAEAQARALASSQIATVAMLSCNPASFARDAAILAEGGFTLGKLAAFDQFRYSAHVEIAALFLRKASKPRLRGLRGR
jgi:23S rRNA (uracil1939-C5)-methyltransferase